MDNAVENGRQFVLFCRMLVKKSHVTSSHGRAGKKKKNSLTKKTRVKYTRALRETGRSSCRSLGGHVSVGTKKEWYAL